MVRNGFVAAAVAAAAAAAEPTLSIQSALVLEGEPANENFASKNQAMNIWKNGAGKEHIVGLIHRFGDMDRRADDKQFAVAWETDGQTTREVRRVELSCPDVELAVPSRGPYVFEARLDLSPFSLHPECSCQPNVACPAGVRVSTTNSSQNATSFLVSPLATHFVHLQNEWNEYVADRAALGRLEVEVDALVATAGSPETGCPGTSDEPVGTNDVTFSMLRAKGITNLTGVAGKWCLVRRGGCAETAKVKRCEASGAIGTIVADHGQFESAGDQEIIVRYNRAEGERGTRPVLFVSKAEGDALFGSIASGVAVRVVVGPTVGGAPTAGFMPGSGITVHGMSPELSGAAAKKSYPGLFLTAGWVEASDERDVLFVCFPSLSEIRLYDISNPMVDITRLGRIEAACSRDSHHDYRILDYKDKDGRYTTILVDPADKGNKLYYYDTQDPSRPTALFSIHANWEAGEDGLGQMRPGGPGGRYHFITWHCSSIYCEGKQGDALYILDSKAPQDSPKVIDLPMLSQGSFSRDVACDDGVCLVSLAWDGVVAVDASDSVNQFRAISHYAGAEFRDDRVPLGQQSLKRHSGAQKVYASTLRPRLFYVEHFNFSSRHFRLEDPLRSVRSRDLYFAELTGYDESVLLPGNVAPTTFGQSAGDGAGTKRDDHRHDHDGDGKKDRKGARPLVIIAAVSAVVLLGLAICTAALLLRRRRRSMSAPPSGSAVDERNVVVGRPVEDGGDAAAQGHAVAAAGATGGGEPEGEKQSA